MEEVIAKQLVIEGVSEGMAKQGDRRSLVVSPSPCAEKLAVDGIWEGWLTARHQADGKRPVLSPALSEA